MDLPGEVFNSLAQLLMIAALSIVLPLPLAFRLSCIVLPSGVSSMPIRNQDQKSSKRGCLYAYYGSQFSLNRTFHQIQ